MPHSTFNPHGTTILCVRRGGRVAMGGDGQVTLGNTVMKGYLRNPSANEAAFAGGWFRTGDLGVLHPDGYIEVKVRAKDIGEWIDCAADRLEVLERESVEHFEMWHAERRKREKLELECERLRSAIKNGLRHRSDADRGSFEK
jgi:acyl-CoA synthetase (AMP-forming)/AMP-acid ligase II